MNSTDRKAIFKASTERLRDALADTLGRLGEAGTSAAYHKLARRLGSLDKALTGAASIEEVQS